MLKPKPQTKPTAFADCVAANDPVALARHTPPRTATLLCADKDCGNTEPSDFSPNADPQSPNLCIYCLMKKHYS